MLRRLADLVVYLLIVFPLNLVEFASNTGYNQPLTDTAGSLFMPAVSAIFLLILAGRLRLAILVQAIYGVSVSALKGIQDSETYTGGDLVAVMLPMVLFIVIIPVSLMYGFQKLVVERRSAD
jgi:hypothetical protein